MFFTDVLKFLNRLGVRPVNDVTAQVTADVTAGMDPEGMGAHMGAGVPSDHSVLLDAINSNGTNLKTTFIIENQKTIKYVDTRIQEEGDERKKDIKDVKAAMQKENNDLRKRLALLEQGAARNKKARQEPNDAPTQANNITWNKAKNSFGWMKMVKGVTNGNKGFASAEEAALDMQRFYVVAVQGSVPVRGSLV
jgi:sulfite reductase alpha subunit-like flavoprotein